MPRGNTSSRVVGAASLARALSSSGTMGYHWDWWLMRTSSSRTSTTPIQSESSGPGSAPWP